jgi:hypothetical protein
MMQHKPSIAGRSRPAQLRTHELNNTKSSPAPRKVFCSALPLNNELESGVVKLLLLTFIIKRRELLKGWPSKKLSRVSRDEAPNIAKRGTPPWRGTFYEAVLS